jgi:adenylate kinase
MSKIVVIMGAPGAGKGTQARLLQERTGLPQISTGDMFRAMKDAKTPLADEVRAVMAAGTLVPDEVTVRVVEDRTGREDCAGGYILDGFPRTPAQAEMLENLAARQGHDIVACCRRAARHARKAHHGPSGLPRLREIYNVHFRPPKREGVCDLHPDAKLRGAPTTTPTRSDAAPDLSGQHAAALEFYEKVRPPQPHRRHARAGDDLRGRGEDGSEW